MSLQLRSASVVQAYIDRIYEVDPYINAIVDRRFEDALEEAKEADALVDSGKMTREQLMNEKPLLGVPFTVKILITVKGNLHFIGRYLNIMMFILKFSNFLKRFKINKLLP